MSDEDDFEDFEDEGPELESARVWPFVLLALVLVGAWLGPTVVHAYRPQLRAVLRLPDEVAEGVMCVGVPLSAERGAGPQPYRMECKGEHFGGNSVEFVLSWPPSPPAWPRLGSDWNAHGLEGGGGR